MAKAFLVGRRTPYSVASPIMSLARFWLMEKMCCRGSQDRNLVTVLHRSDFGLHPLRFQRVLVFLEKQNGMKMLISIEDFDVVQDKALLPAALQSLVVHEYNKTVLYVHTIEECLLSESD